MLDATALAAAHSMDTSWFAVDDDGHVAVMTTGEEGFLPDDAERMDDASAQWIEQATARAGAFVIERTNWLEIYGEEFPCESSAGVFVYSHERDYRPVGFYYERVARPLAPVTVSDLPEPIASRCFHLRGARFELMPAVQPLDHAPGTAYSDKPFWSLSAWRPERWEDESLRLDDAVIDDFYPDTVPGSLLRWDAVLALRVLFLRWINGAAPSWDEVDQSFGAVVRAALDPAELDRVRDALTHHRSRDHLEPRLLAVRDAMLLRWPNPLQRPRVWHPYGAPDGHPMRVEARSELERLCARGALPLSWLSDSAGHRRFLPSIDEWLATALLREARDERDAMSVGFLPAPVLERLSRDAASTLAAESLAREERGDGTLYWRQASQQAMLDARALRAGGATERERAIFDLGFVLDPVVRDVPVLWVESP